jgi:hypothetical protein
MQAKTFTVPAGRRPKNTAGVKIDDQRAEFRYSTVPNGKCYRVKTDIRCEDTGAVDACGRPIYRDDRGTEFVWVYRPGDARTFDSGAFEVPAA